MTRRLGILSTIVAVSALAAGCGSDSSSASTTAAAAATTTSAAAAATTTPPETAAVDNSVAPASGELADAATVDIKQFKFGPPEVHVAVGGTVTWANSDNQKHTATSAGAFDTAAIEAGSDATATFESAGTFAYICSFHPFMKGTVVVGA